MWKISKYLEELNKYFKELSRLPPSNYANGCSRFVEMVNCHPLMPLNTIIGSSI